MVREGIVSAAAGQNTTRHLPSPTELHFHNGLHASGNALAGRNDCQYKLCRWILPRSLGPKRLQISSSRIKTTNVRRRCRQNVTALALVPGKCSCRCLQYIRGVSFLSGQSTALTRLLNRSVKCQLANTCSAYTVGVGVRRNMCAQFEKQHY